MNKNVTKALRELGCNDKQQRFFIANFDLGSAGVNDIASKAKLQRSTAYLIADELLEIGLITEDSKAHGRSFTAISPAQLIRMLESHHRRLGKLNIALREDQAELEARYKNNNVIPRVRTYHGHSGLTSILRDVLKSKTEILLWTNQATETSFFSPELHDRFVQERVAKQIPTRVLAVDNPKGQGLLLHDEENLRITKILPEGMSFTAETYLYDNKLAMIDFSGDIIGVVIESSSVNESQTAMFENTWKSL